MAKVKKVLEQDGFCEINERTMCSAKGISGYLLVLSYQGKNRLVYRWDELLDSTTVFEGCELNPVYIAVSTKVNNLFDWAQDTLEIPYQDAMITIYGGGPSSKNTQEAIEYFMKVGSVADLKVRKGEGFHEMGDEEIQDFAVTRERVDIIQEASLSNVGTAGHPSSNTRLLGHFPPPILPSGTGRTTQAGQTDLQAGQAELQAGQADEAPGVQRRSRRLAGKHAKFSGLN